MYLTDMIFKYDVEKLFFKSLKTFILNLTNCKGKFDINTLITPDKNVQPDEEIWKIKFYFFRNFLSALHHY